MKKCSIDKCERKHQAKGLCKMHYARLWQYGRVELTRRPITERFHAADRKGAPDECWLWEKSKSAKGYGQINSGGTMARAHRVAWELSNGPIPKGVCVLHKCDVPICVNPSHLFLGTLKDNFDDAVAKGRIVRSATGPFEPLTKTPSFDQEEYSMKYEGQK